MYWWEYLPQTWQSDKICSFSIQHIYEAPPSIYALFYGNKLSIKAWSLKCRLLLRNQCIMMVFKYIKKLLLNLQDTFSPAWSLSTNMWMTLVLEHSPVEPLRHLDKTLTNHTSKNVVYFWICWIVNQSGAVLAQHRWLRTLLCSDALLWVILDVMIIVTPWLFCQPFQVLLSIWECK